MPKVTQIVLVSLYLVTTVLLVDFVYQRSLSLRGRLVPQMDGRQASSVSYMLGLLPPLSGLLTATLFSLFVPALALGSYLWSAGGLMSVALGAGIALVLSLLAVGPCMIVGSVECRTAPAQELPARIWTLLLVGLDLLISAAFEEVVFRGQLLSGLLNVMNPTAAVAVSAGLFGLVHIWKQREAPLLWAFNTMLFGLVAGRLVLLTGNIASAIALHFVWNLLQTPVLGLPANGSDYEHGLLVSRIRGRGLLTGGSWSLDAGLAATAALALGLVILAIAP